MAIIQITENSIITELDAKVFNPLSLNAGENLYPDYRKESKAPTFALTYQGTYYTLIRNCGFSEEKARRIESRFQELYADSIQWVDDKLRQASNDGYVTVAFGLRLRTPLLAQCMYGSPTMPYQATKEGRTAGNALGQSYGLLNNRAAIEFRERTLDSNYALDVRPSAHIHDSQYFMVREDLAVLHWVNENLIPCMEWQELPEIQHDEVKLGGQLEVYYPDWAKAHKLPNNATDTEIAAICKKAGENK